MLVRRLSYVVASLLLLHSSPAHAWAPLTRSPDPVRLEIADTQVVRVEKSAMLLLKLSIANQSPAPLEFKVSQLALRVGDHRLVASQPTAEQDMASVVVAGQESRRISELPLLEDAKLARRDEAAGWLLIDLAPVKVQPESLSALAELDWRIVGKVGAVQIDFDLRAHEVAALAARRRPCQDEPSVPVIEVAGRVNSLNVGKLIELATGAPEDPPGFILRFTSDDCQVENLVRAGWHRFESRDWPRPRRGRSDRRLWCVLWQDEPPREDAPLARRLPPPPRGAAAGRNARVGGRAGGGVGGGGFAGGAAGGGGATGTSGQGRRDSFWSAGHQTAPTETRAMLLVLADRPNASAMILKYVSHRLPEVRAAAVSALGMHQKEPGVFEAIVAAAADNDSAVRQMALSRLQVSRQLMPAADCRDDGPAGDAVAAALDDADEAIRLSAVAAASGLTGERLNEPLLALLNDTNLAMRAGAAYSLGVRRCQAAVPGLRRLWQDDTDHVKAAALNALDQLGALGEDEASLARLELDQATPNDIETLIKRRDPAIIPKLLSLALRDNAPLKPNQFPRFPGGSSAIEVLAGLDLPETVEPLIRLLSAPENLPRGRGPGRFRPGRFRRGVSTTEQLIVRALTRLGDRRAIEPLREALERADDTLSARMHLYEGLISVGASDALRGLADLEDITGDPEAPHLLELLARYDDDEAVVAFERFLDNQRFASDAAEKLSYLTRPSARMALERRLLSTHARLGPRWLEGLARNPLWLVRSESRELIERVADGPHEATKASAKELLTKLGGAPREEPGEPVPATPPDFLPDSNGEPIAVPAELDVGIDCTQFTNDSLYGAFCLRLAIENRTDQPLAYRASDFLLRVGDRWLAASMPSGNVPHLPLHLPVEVGGQTRIKDLPFLSDGSLPPHGKAQHWLWFELLSLDTEVRTPLDTEKDTWLLVGRVGKQPFAIDLKAIENQAIAVRWRRSTTDARVAVAELSGRLNCFNYAKFREAMAEAPVDEPGIILLPDEGNWMADAAAAERWRQEGRRRLNIKTIREGDTVTRVFSVTGTVGRPSTSTVKYRLGVSTSSSSGRQEAPLPADELVVSGVLFSRWNFNHEPLSEAEATLAILGERPGTGRSLVGYLHDKQVEIRRAAALALQFHLLEEGVVKALIEALSAPDSDVRLAAVMSLGADDVAAPPGMRRGDSPVGVALLKLLESDDLQLVDWTMRSLAGFSGERIDEALLKLLDRPSAEASHDFESRELSGIGGAACVILAKRHCQVAIEKLHAIVSGPVRPNEGMLRADAIRTLEEMGELSPADALLARLEADIRTHQEVDHIDDYRNNARVIAAMIGKLNEPAERLSLSRGSAIRPDDAAWLLSLMGAQEAIDPMLALLARGEVAGKPLPLLRALAKLGDPRAIEPIRRALTKAAPNWRLRLYYYEALARLGDAEAVDTLLALTQEPLAQQDIHQFMRILGDIHDRRVPGVIEPFLDHGSFCTTAADAFGQLPPELALPPLERRLSSADYRFGRSVLQTLARRATWWHGPAGRSLLKLAAASANPATRQAAAAPLDD